MTRNIATFNIQYSTFITVTDARSFSSEPQTFTTTFHMDVANPFVPQFPCLPTRPEARCVPGTHFLAHTLSTLPDQEHDILVVHSIIFLAFAGHRVWRFQARHWYAVRPEQRRVDQCSQLVPVTV